MKPNTDYIPTRLEYIVAAVLGPPNRVYGNGKSTFECPQCGDEETFSTRRHHPKYRDRYGCFRCKLWGDEKDILAFVRPKLSKKERHERLRELRIEYRRAYHASADADVPLGELFKRVLAEMKHSNGPTSNGVGISPRGARSPSGLSAGAGRQYRRG